MASKFLCLHKFLENFLMTSKFLKRVLKIIINSFRISIKEKL